MNPFVFTLIFVIDILWWIMVIHIVMSWLIQFQVLNPYQPLVRQIWQGLSAVLEPIYRPIRNFLPRTGGLDFTPLIVFVGLIFLRQFVIYYLA
ncbi:MAG: YggT family protein [Pseudomonadota bacterium]